MARIFVVGIARSGTTWVAETLAHARDTRLVNEPDNVENSDIAAVGKAGLGFMPALDPDERVPRYEVLWRLAFRGGWPDSVVVGKVRAAARRLPRGPRLATYSALARACARAPAPTANVVVKSVFGLLALDWIVARFRPRMVIVRRHPLNVLASWLELGVPPYPINDHPLVRRRLIEPLGLSPPAGDASRTEEVAWTIGLLSSVLEDAVERHPDWVSVSHEGLAARPAPEFAALVARLGLPWDDAIERHLAASNRPGSGYERARVASELQGSWRRRLDDRQAEEARATLAAFPAIGRSQGS